MNPPDSCLDAETLAAWVDGGLRGDEFRMAQTHVADCARCQALVGAMARTEAAVPQLEPQRTPRRWLAWAVPLTAAATALVIWTIVPRNPVTTQPVATEAARTASPAASQTEIVVSPEIIPEKEEAAAEKKPAAAAPPPPAQARDQLAEREAIAPQQEARKDAAAAAPAAEPTATLAAPAPTAAPAPRRAEGRAQAAQSANIATFAPRMQDLCGASWTGPAPAVTTPLTAGTSPASNVCWIVGRLGVVLLTTDGRTWTGLMFPAITDLSSVTATSARNATVVTTDGRRFVTTDGGMTWNSQQPAAGSRP